MNFSAVILAGGNSSRMGRDKAFIQIGGRTLLALQIETARAAGAVEVFISGRPGVDYSAFGCQVLHDHFSDAGPLAGIEVALASATDSIMLALAVDLPAMNPEFLRQLAMCCAGNLGAIPRVNGYLEPLAAFYKKAAQPLAETVLRTGDRSVATFAEQCVQAGHARFVDFTPAGLKYFANWNFPADVATGS